MSVPVIELSDDAQVQELCLAASCTMPATPQPGCDICMVAFQAHECFWIVIKFFQAGDSGYVAYGVPESYGQEEANKVFRHVLYLVDRGARERGIVPEQPQAAG